MRTILLLLVVPVSLLAQGENASSSAFRQQAEMDARRQLQDAVRTENWQLVKEAAEELDRLKKINKAAEKPAKIDGFQKLRDAGFSLSRAPDEEKKGARFGFTDNIRSGTGAAFDSDFYLKWTPMPWHDQYFHLWNTFAISAQGKLSGSSSSASDAWRFRLEDRFWTYNREQTAGRIFDGIVATMSLESESDRKFEMNRLSAELWLTLNARRLYIGQYSGDDNSWFQVRWRPYVGLNAGGAINDSTNDQDVNSPLWMLMRGRLDLRLNALRKALGLSDIVAYVDNKFVYISEVDDGHNYFDSGIDFEFNDHVGLALQYTIGADSPEFVREELFKGGLTVKF